LAPSSTGDSSYPRSGEHNDVTAQAETFPTSPTITAAIEPENPGLPDDSTQGILHEMAFLRQDHGLDSDLYRFPDFFERIMMPEVPNFEIPNGSMMVPDVSNMLQDIDFQMDDIDYSFLEQPSKSMETGSVTDQPPELGLTLDPNPMPSSNTSFRFQVFKKSPWLVPALIQIYIN